MKEIKKKPKKGVASRENAKITHIMADGTIRDSIEGYVIPYNENTAHIYRRHADYIREHYM